MRGKEKRESGKARLRAKASAEGNDGKIRRGDIKEAKSEEKSEKRGERAESRQRPPPPRRILAFPTPSHTARNPPP